MRYSLLGALVGIFAMIAADMAEAQRGSGFGGRDGMGMRGGNMGQMRKKMDAEKPPYEQYEQKGLFATGLAPIFPEGLTCPDIASPYGSKTRYDGSSRKNNHYGYHNGMDISLTTGTPLVAIADGEVIHKGSAGKLVGNYIWVRYAPEVIGLPVYAFIRYQHLDNQSPLEVGAQVKVGDILGPSGSTGTAGKHYGVAGYPHLHMNILFGLEADYTIKGAMIGPKSLNYLDPMGLFIKKPVAEISNHILKSLPESEKNLPVAVKTTDGRIVPEGAKVIWPVLCEVD